MYIGSVVPMIRIHNNCNIIYVIITNSYVNDHCISSIFLIPVIQLEVEATGSGNNHACNACIYIYGSLYHDIGGCVIAHTLPHGDLF